MSRPVSLRAWADAVRKPLHRWGQSRAGGVLIKCGRWAAIVWNWIPLSLLGWLAVPAMAALLRFYGYGRQDQILLVLCLGGLALTCLLALSTLACGLWLRLRREEAEGPPLEFFADTPFVTGYCIPRLAWHPLLRIDVEWHSPHEVDAILFSRHGDLCEEAVSSRRAWQDDITRRFTVGDVFGLTRVRFTRTTVQKVRVAPDLGEAAPLRPLVQFQSGDLFAHPDGRPEGDLVEMRNYAHGDPLKRVLWKTFARTGKMMVRVHERAVAPCDRLLACFIAAQGDEPSAGVARALLENGSLGGDFLFCADGEPEPTSRADEAVEQIMRSANVTSEQSGSSLAAMLRQVSLDSMQACVLFAPPRRGDWLDTVTRQVASAPGKYYVLVGVDHLSPQLHWTRRALFRPEATGARQVAELAAVCQTLQEAGADVRIIDRRLGRQYQTFDIVEMLAPPRKLGAPSSAHFAHELSTDH